MNTSTLKNSPLGDADIRSCHIALTRSGKLRFFAILFSLTLLITASSSCSSGRDGDSGREADAIETESDRDSRSGSRSEIQGDAADEGAGLDREGARADADLRQLASWMSGHFSSAAHAQRDAEKVAVRLEMAPIWKARKDGPWLYVEQAVIGYDYPYRQRIYRLEAMEDGRFRSSIYKLPAPDTMFTGAHLNPAKLAGLSPDSLELMEGCAVYLKKQPDGSYYGETETGACGNTMRNAAYATSEVTVREDRIISWDRGWDSQGNQVWGAERSGYEFMKVPLEEGPTQESGREGT